MAANSTVGLGHVLFNLAPAASGVIPVSIQGFPDTGINDPAGANITISSFVPGSITIMTTAAVPEPHPW